MSAYVYLRITLYYTIIIFTIIIMAIICVMTHICFTKFHNILQIKPVVIKKFISSGGWGMFALVMLGLVVFIVIQVLLNLWLSSWSNDVAMYSFAEARNRTSGRLGIYGALAAVACEYL